MRFLFFISRPGRLWLYLLTCFAIAAAVYGGLLRAIDWLFFAGVSATIVLYQIVNFHHYIVDALIWRTRRPAPRRVCCQSTPFGNLNLLMMADRCPLRISFPSLWHLIGYDSGRPSTSG